VDIRYTFEIKSLWPGTQHGIKLEGFVVSKARPRVASDRPSSEVAKPERNRRCW
jgi:hypothetical protein